MMTSPPPLKQQLDARVPILFLPVRLETRFGQGDKGPELWIRVFPAQIAIDTHEDPLTRPDLAKHYPLQMVCPPEASFLNSTFVNVETLRRSATEPKVQIHPDDAEHRNIRDGHRLVC